MNDNCDEDVELTHLGQSLAQIEKFNKNDAHSEEDNDNESEYEREKFNGN